MLAAADRGDTPGGEGRDRSALQKGWFRLLRATALVGRDGEPEPVTPRTPEGRLVEVPVTVRAG